MEHLRASLSVGEEGTFRAIASHAASTANGERGPTRFATGAFRESLGRSTRYPLLWQHKDDQPVGVVELSESTEGLIADGRLALEVQRAREARELLKMGAVDGVSIGFTAEKARHETHGGKSVRVVEQAKLMEVSLVTFPADPAARVLTVHRESDEEADFAVAAALQSIRLHLVPDEAHAGRVFSESNLTKLRAALGTLVDLVEKVDPGHIASLGRRAARTLRKSFIVTDKATDGRVKAAQTHARLRRMEALAAGMDIPVADLPLLDKTFAPAMPQEDGLDYALRRSVDGALAFPAEARRPLLASIAKQYLVAIGDAEEVGEEDEDSDAEDRETHIHNPHVKEVDGKFAVVDDDGKVYGTHETKAEAEAQVRALNAAKDKE
jgi:hypothetical protein